jgi:hypothetical protein
MMVGSSNIWFISFTAILEILVSSGLLGLLAVCLPVIFELLVLQGY